MLVFCVDECEIAGWTTEAQVQEKVCCDGPPIQIQNGNVLKEVVNRGYQPVSLL